MTMRDECVTMNILSDSDLLVIKEEQGQPVGYPLTYSNFRMLYPQTSFPEVPENSFVSLYGYKVFRYQNPPAVPAFYTVGSGTIVWDEALSAYINTYVLTPFTEQQMATARATRLSDIRRERNQRLTASDWTQLPDSPVTAALIVEWRAYRKSLRDYMALVVDPFNPPAWPTPPVS